MLLGIFASVMADEFFTIPTEEAKECLQAAQEMRRQFAEVMVTDVHQQFCDWLVSGLRKLVDSAGKSGGRNFGQAFIR